MKKQKFLTSVTYKFDPAICMEKIPGKSMTVAGESYTVQELFERHLSGQLPSVASESYFEDTQDFDAIDFQALKYADPFEKAELLLDVQERAKRAYESLEKWKKANPKDASSNDDDSTSESSSPTKKSKSKNASEDGEPESKRSGASDANSSERTEDK